MSFRIIATSSAVVSSVGETTINTDFTITNLTASKYLPEYILQFDQLDLTDFKVTPVGKNKISLETSPTNNLPPGNVKIIFTDEIVGEEKSNLFRLTYNAPTAAKIDGQYLEFTLPQATQASLYDEEKVTIEVPSTFGAVKQNTAHQFINSATTKDNNLEFDNTKGQKIHLAYGEIPTFIQPATQLLHNPSNYPLNIKFTLPANIVLQENGQPQINPPPTKIDRDENQNFILTYLLTPQAKTNVNYNLIIKNGDLSNQTNQAIIGYKYADFKFNLRQFTPKSLALAGGLLAIAFIAWRILVYRRRK